MANSLTDNLKFEAGMLFNFVLEGGREVEMVALREFYYDHILRAAFEEYRNHKNEVLKYPKPGEGFYNLVFKAFTDIELMQYMIANNIACVTSRFKERGIIKLGHIKPPAGEDPNA